MKLALMIVQTKLGWWENDLPPSIVALRDLVNPAIGKAVTLGDIQNTRKALGLSVHGEDDERFFEIRAATIRAEDGP